MTNNLLEERIIAHEGVKKSAYQDSLGYWSVGIGFCIDARLNLGLSFEECMMILRSRLANLEKQLSNYQWFTSQDIVRQGVLIELAYNMGIEGLLTFEKMIAALQMKQPALAAKELLDSKWATQVGKDRKNDILLRLREGSYGKTS